MDLGLKRRVAVLTGSGRGIGRAAALALADEGAKVVISDVDTSAIETCCDMLRANGHECLGIAADVCDPQQVESMVAQVVAQWGKVDILVNNAGFTRDNYLLKMPETDWDAVLNVVLKGAYVCTKAVLPSMMEQRWGRVINISSRAHLGNPGQTNYSAAKAGLIGFTRALSLEQGKFNITANAIAPGFIETELVRALPTYAALRDAAIKSNPVRRVGSPDDVAAAVLYLASERAGYITGETLHVSGGRFASS